MEAIRESYSAPGVERYADSKAYHNLAQWAANDLQQLSYEDVKEAYARILESHGNDNKALAIIGLCDRSFLLTALCGRKDALHPWLYGRCREVEANPNGCLDLWARDHYKSTIITFAGVLQEILRNPETTVGIFSHTRPISKKFLQQIKREMEGNELLKAVYSDVLWAKPQKDAPKWSDDDGLILKRRGNPKESTVEAWGLVEGQPTSKHFDLRVYDDVVTRDSVTTPEMVKKTTEALELSENLGTRGGRAWYIGTRYLLGDTYQTLIDRGVVETRLYPATDNGRLDGNPVFLSPEQWEKKKINQPSTVAAQMLQNPAAGNEATFNPYWFQSFDKRPDLLNIYILVDPSKGSTQRSDRTAMAVIGVDQNSVKYLLDGYRHRMPLFERWERLRDLHRHWSNQRGVQRVQVAYGRFGMQADVDHFESRMRIEDYHFQIEEVAWPRQGGAAKEDRVERLSPDLRGGKLLLSAVVWHETLEKAAWTVENGEVKHVATDITMDPIKRLDENNKPYDLTRAFLEEAAFFPYGTHDDLLDAASRIYDLEFGISAPQGNSAKYDDVMRRHNETINRTIY